MRTKALLALLALGACEAAHAPAVEVTLTAQTQEERAADFPLVVAAWVEYKGDVAGLQTLCAPSGTDLTFRFVAETMDGSCTERSPHAAIASWTFQDDCIELKADAELAPGSAEVPDLEVVEEWLKAADGDDHDPAQCLSRVAL